MRKMSAATVLAVAALFAIPTAAGAADNAPQCPITQGSGVTIVNISSELMLAWDAGKASAGPVAVSLPVGSYGVVLVSWDAHSTKTSQAQTEEQWYLELWGAGATPMTATGATADLPENLDLSAYDMGTVTIDEPLTAVRAVHAAYPDEFEPHSVAPLCVSFLGTETSGGNENTGGTTATTGTTGNTGGTTATTGGTGATSGTTSTTAAVTGSGSDEVGVLSSGPVSQTLQQLPLTGIQFETALVAILTMLLGILLLRKSRLAQARLERRNARVWRRPVR